MTTIGESIRQGAAQVQRELDEVLEGMDYCLDWRPDDKNWSAREVLWHILEDPEGGIPNAIHGIIQGTLPELTIIADETHLNPQREAMDLEAIRGELKRYFDRLEEVLKGATDGQISQLTTSCWFPLRNLREHRSAQNLLEGLFLRHWRDHLGQLRDLRKGLGL
jgi:hypothetical protein